MVTVYFVLHLLVSLRLSNLINLKFISLNCHLAAFYALMPYANGYIAFEGIWRLQDHHLELRKCLFDMLVRSGFVNAFQRRWRYQQSSINKQVLP
jgi:hypothetical protein